MNIGNPFAMVVMIVLIVYGAKVWRAHLLSRGYRGRSESDERMIGGMSAQIERLTDRVAVLEKLVTDDDRKLAADIERLRRDGRPESRL